MSKITSKEFKDSKNVKFKRTLGVWLLLLPAVIALYLMIWRPSVMGIVWSFFKMKGYTPVEFTGFENYIRVFTNTEFSPIMGNTIE